MAEEANSGLAPPRPVRPGHPGLGDTRSVGSREGPSSGTGPAIDELVVADPPEAWRAVGFAVDGDLCRIGRVGVRLAGPDAGRGLAGWSVSGLRSTDLDGLPTTPGAGWTVVPAEHPNGSLAIDHVVAFSPDLDRTVAAIEAAGLPLRRIREGPTPGGAMRQAFFRLDEVILEVIEHPEGSPGRADRNAPARLWGFVLVVDDLDETAAGLGDDLGSARDAVQPGRRIATLRRSAGLSVPLAFITPERGEAAAIAGS